MAPPPGFMTLGAYARLAGRNAGALRKLAARGDLEGARKVDGAWVVPDPRARERMPARGVCRNGTRWWIAALQPSASSRWQIINHNRGLTGAAALLGLDPDHAQDYQWFVGFQEPNADPPPKWQPPGYFYITVPNAESPLNDGPEVCAQLVAGLDAMTTNPRSVPNIICRMLCEQSPTVELNKARRVTRRQRREEKRKTKKGRRATPPGR